jgi:hypothetical protein
MSLRGAAAAIVLIPMLVIAARDTDASAVLLGARPGVIIAVETHDDDGPSALRANGAIVRALIEAATDSGVQADRIRTYGVSIVPEITEVDLVATYRVSDMVLISRPSAQQVQALQATSDRLGVQLMQGSLNACPVPPPGIDARTWTKQWSAFG